MRAQRSVSLRANSSDVDVGDHETLHGVTISLHERAVHGQHRDLAADRLGVVVVERGIGAVAIDDRLGAERLPHHGHVDFLSLQGGEIVAAAADDVDDLQSVVLQRILLDPGREFQPRDRAGADADALVGHVLPVLDVLALAHEQAIVALAKARDADQGFRSLPERERDVLRPERGELEVARDERGARVGEALEHYHFDLDVVLGRLLGQ